MYQTQQLKGDLNNNGTIDNTKEARTNIEFNAHDITRLQSEISKLKRNMIVDSVSKNNEFASSAKIAEELTDGKQRIIFNNIGKSVVFKNGIKPMTSCLQICSNDNSIKNVSHIHFADNSTIKGLIDDYTTVLTNEEGSQYVPTINYISEMIDPSIEAFAGNFIELNNKTHDITYDETTSTTTIANDLEVNGNINCDWLTNEFAKYALVGHNHDSTYASINHTHEFADIYKQITRTIVNNNTNEEEEVTETKTLQEVLTEYEQTMNTAINGKANVAHTHEFADIYKQTVTDNGDGTTTTTTKTLEQLLNEREAALQSLINSKANTSHTHNATEVTYKTNVTVKKALDDLNEQLDIVDSQGKKINILSVLFGVDAVVGGLIDGGLVAAVATLQNEIDALGTESLTSDVIGAVCDAGDVVQGGKTIWDGLKGIANAWKQFRTAAKGYQQLMNLEALPLEDIPIV